MSRWYYPDGTSMHNVSEWSNRSEGSMWRREHIVSDVPGGTVSTVWLGLDHGYGGTRPLIFESLVSCDGPLNQEMDRYATREEARAGHERLVERVNAERRAWLELSTNPDIREAVALVAKRVDEHMKVFGAEYGRGDLLDVLCREVTR